MKQICQATALAMLVALAVLPSFATGLPPQRAQATHPVLGAAPLTTVPAVLQQPGSLQPIETAISPYPTGTCHTSCAGIVNGRRTFTTVYWESTESQCCSGTTNPCPAGTAPIGTNSFFPNQGDALACGPTVQ